MKNWIRYCVRSLMLVLCLSGATQQAVAQDGRGPSTEEEREKVVQMVDRVNKDASSLMRSADGRWFMKWADDVPDYFFGPDSGALWVMTGIKNGEIKGEFVRVVQFVHSIHTAAYQVKNKILDPLKSPEAMHAKAVAGLDGLLAVYEVMLAANQTERSARLDQGLKAKKEGKLDEFVKALPPFLPR